MRSMFAGFVLVCFVCTVHSSDPEKTSSFDLILQANLELQPDPKHSSPPLPNNVFEGDIALTDEQRRNIDIFGSTAGRAASKDPSIRWPGGVIPYEIDCSLQKMPDALDAIKKAMKEWETSTCIRFIPRTNQKDYLWFFRQKGCWCNVGRIGGKTTLSVGDGCEFQHVMVHEIGHAVGFWHEQSRPDRDSYVRVIKANILPGFENAFEKYSRGKIDSMRIPYDYGSIMHYPFTAFSRNGQPTLKALRPLNGKSPYKKLSALDAQQTNLMYNNCLIRNAPRKRQRREATRNTRQKRAVCRDYRSDCTMRVRYGQCTRYPRFMRTWCRRSCRFCTTTTTTGSNCRDYNRFCRSWAQRGECWRNRQYMHVNCRLSCKLCGPIRPRPPTRRPRPPTRRPRPPTRRPRPPTHRPKPPTKGPRPPTKPPVGRTCGIRYYGRHPGRIVDGQTATKNSWPWQVQFLTSYGAHHCGGSLVTDQWVVTAAHCVYGSSDNPGYKLKLGEHHLRRNDGTEQRFSIAKIIVHPGYIRSTLDNDIALLRLDRPVKFNKAVSPICLPSHGVSVPVGTNCYITGWGRTGSRRPGSTVLQEAMMPIVDQQKCAQAMKRWGSITKNMLCGGFGGSSTVSGCMGDSGGPFVCKGRNGKWTLQGAVSWGTRSCSAGRNQYTVYARISVYVNWIRRYIGKTPTGTRPPQTPPPPKTPPTIGPEITPPRPNTPPPITRSPPPNTPSTGTVPTTSKFTRPTAPTCSLPKPLGLENKQIPDSALLASSQVNRWHSAREGRLNRRAGITGVGAWCSRDQTKNEYLEIDLGATITVTGVATQGRESKFPKFVKSYALLYSDDGNSWIKHPSIFTGNVDMSTVTTNSVAPPIFARYIRINPLTWKTAICLRAELYGCPVVPSTSAPTTTRRPKTTTNPPQTTKALTTFKPSTNSSKPSTPPPVPPTPSKVPPTPPVPSTQPPVSSTSPPVPPTPPVPSTQPPVSSTSSPVPPTPPVPSTQLPVSSTSPPVPPTPPVPSTQPPVSSTLPPKPPTLPPKPPTLPPTKRPVTETIPPNPVGIRCWDGHPSCPTWATEGKCNTDNYVQKNCLKSCNSKRCDREPVRPFAPCSNRLGLGWDYKLPDSAFTASSQLNLGSWDAGARNARMYYIDNHVEKRTGAWCAASRKDQWLQVDLGTKTYITAVATQGRHKYFEHVKSYKLAYSVDGAKWKYVTDSGSATAKVFKGNCDHFTPVVNRLPVAVSARYIKFYPVTANWICMRVEIYGCK